MSFRDNGWLQNFFVGLLFWLLPSRAEAWLVITRLARRFAEWRRSGDLTPPASMPPPRPIFVQPNYAAINEAYQVAHDEAVHAAIRASMRNNTALFAHASGKSLVSADLS